MDNVRVVIHSPDQLTRIGLACALSMGGSVQVLGPRDPGRAQVLLYATTRFESASATRLRREAVELDVPVVLVVDDLEEGDMLTAVRCGVVAVMLRSTMSVDRLTECVVGAAAGGAMLPSDALGSLLGQVRNLWEGLVEQRGLNELGLSQRELDVLRLLADGHDTSEISDKLAYSERTIKNILSTVLSRLGLRNRTHAVAIAIRSGLV